MRAGLGALCCSIIAIGMAGLGVADAQSRSETPGDCGAEICLQTGSSYWRYDATQYCEGDVCLRDSLDRVADQNWDRLVSGHTALITANRNPYVGLTDAEYVRLRELGRSGEVAERIGLLRKVRAACRPMEFALRLDIPGYDVVVVTFTMPLAAPGAEGTGFQVTKIHRTFKNLPGGSVGWWIRWISNRFPGIALLEGEPTEFASYEIGLYMGGLVLFDKEFRTGTAKSHAAQPGCEQA